MLFSCHAMLFDLDGVLVDSDAAILARWQKWAAWHGLDVEPIWRICHGVQTVQTIRRVAPHLDAEQEAASIMASDLLDARGLKAYPGAAALLQSLPRDSWAIVTSGKRELALARLVHTGLPVPDVLVTAEDVVRGKPDAEAFLLAARRLDLPAEGCLVVEDAPAGLRAARAAGMMAIGVATTHVAAQLQDAHAVVAGIDRLRVTAGSGEGTPHAGKGPLQNRIQVHISDAKRSDELQRSKGHKET